MSLNEIIPSKPIIVAGQKQRKRRVDHGTRGWTPPQLTMTQILDISLVSLEPSLYLVNSCLEDFGTSNIRTHQNMLSCLANLATAYGHVFPIETGFQPRSRINECAIGVHRLQANSRCELALVNCIWIHTNTVSAARPSIFLNWREYSSLLLECVTLSAILFHLGYMTFFPPIIIKRKLDNREVMSLKY